MSRFGYRPFTVWLTGLSGAGKTTIAYALERRLFDQGFSPCVLDGDHVRHGLCRDLDFSASARHENIRRVAEVARLMNDAGLVVVSALISPFREDRNCARQVVGSDRFVEGFVDAPLEVCEKRDPKALYKKARAGEIRDFTGISAPYEAPSSPDVHLRSDRESVGALVGRLMAHLSDRGLLITPRSPSRASGTRT